MKNNIPKVSVICTSYNHERYICDCIEGFLAQNTDFPFEIIIHDDASKDNTQALVKEYANRYPDIIKPILQKENQYSQGKFITAEVIKQAQGKYIALCEGDDFWCDSQKLQLQFDFMESHPDYSFCGCSRWQLDQIRHLYYPMLYWDDTFPSTSPVSTRRIFLGKHPFHTAGFFFTKSAWQIIEEKLRQDRQGAAMGDAILLFHLSLVGKVHYIHRMMTVYRIAKGSAMNHGNSHKSEEIKQKMMESSVKLAKNNNCDYLIEELMSTRDKEKKLLNEHYNKKNVISRIFQMVTGFGKHIVSGDYYRYFRYKIHSSRQRVRDNENR